MLTRSKRDGRKVSFQTSQRGKKESTSKMTRMSKRAFVLTNSSDEDHTPEEAEVLKQVSESELETEESTDTENNGTSEHEFPEGDEITNDELGEEDDSSDLDFRITTRSTRNKPRINYSDETYYSNRLGDNNGNSKRKAKELFSGDEIEQKRIKPSKQVIRNRRNNSRRDNTYGDSSGQKRRSLRSNKNFNEASYYEGTSNSGEDDD